MEWNTTPGIRSGNFRIDNQFDEEIQRLMAENESSFTALLGLPANQALELLHEPESMKSQEITESEIWRESQEDQRTTFGYSFNCTPTFPTNAALVERAARFSVFATAENSPEASSVPSISSESSPKLKAEPVESESNRNSSPILSSKKNQKSTKRKEREKVKGSGKKSKNVENGNKDGEKLPYVHVRARRGQATDSHSLAERARREKINARMKLLQELVPGCNKISGTALVLDEIINHVQSLQRQVESIGFQLLSMRLAAVNPRFDFNVDNLLAAESGCLSTGSFPSTLTVEPMMWSELQFNGSREQQHQNQQLWEVDVLQPPVWERENYNSFHPSENSVFSYNSSADSVSMHSNQLKMEL